jgi:hypothetical protein
MNLINQYESDEEESIIQKKPIENKIDNINQVQSIIEIKNLSNPIETAPEIDITDMVNIKNDQIVKKFESNYFIPNKQNHLTGYINYHTMNDQNFYEQLHTFNAYGYAQDPTDFTQNKLIGKIDDSMDPNTVKTVYSGTSKSQKQLRKKNKMKRMKYGNPGSGDFMGPWAIYEGEEIFKNLSGELTEEQKEILRYMEEKRQKKMEAVKEEETKNLNVSIFNNNNNISLNRARFSICKKGLTIKGGATLSHLHN